MNVSLEELLLFEYNPNNKITTDVSRKIMRLLSNLANTSSGALTLNKIIKAKNDEVNITIDNLFKIPENTVVTPETIIYDLVLNFDIDTVIPDVAGLYQYNSHPDDPDPPHIRVSIFLPKAVFDRKLLPELALKIKITLQHELEHHSQTGKAGRKFNIKAHSNKFGVHHLIPGTENYDAERVNMKNLFSSIENTLSYYLSPEETEAFVVGLMRKAKTEKEPIERVLKRYLVTIKDNLIANGTKEMQAGIVTDRIKYHWLKYAKIRFPRAFVVNAENK